MSLASGTARTASNQTMALTLYWFIGVLEQCNERLAPDVALDMINEKLSDFERVRLLAGTDEHLKREAA